MDTSVPSPLEIASPPAGLASPPAPPPSPSSSLMQFLEEADFRDSNRCTICNEDLAEARVDETIETPSVLPCGHVFGNLCISRWLHDSTHQNCPICRRRMTYRSCGHTVKPLPVAESPQLVKEEHMPEKCLLCREGSEMLKERIRWVKDRMDAEVRALEGLRVLRMTRGFAAFGGLFCGRTGPTEDFEGRVGESKKVWEDECRKLEEDATNGRCEW
ncbi:uncharacterized protein LY89DRAFT_731314 [Mollisia scopiformis]|uniref:RING-type domain-containing protein n=1 Tax=Mollisia scopiformis TaxID=149040 RepID=A0A194XIX6_MOLSC|nr:uncharacterized protein LY89DRAFT_731314 [Mollisia scopiformis]KUJ20081.1 hypothetical protein LY89DRAFT_731314 [Mollisia scopiformis]